MDGIPSPPATGRACSSPGSSRDSGCSRAQYGIKGAAAPNYRPISLRWPVLIPFALYVCALIGIVEYSCRMLPLADDHDVIARNQSAGALISVPLVPGPTPTPSPGPRPRSLHPISQPYRRIFPRVTHRRRSVNIQSVNGTEISINATVSVITVDSQYEFPRNASSPMVTNATSAEYPIEEHPAEDIFPTLSLSDAVQADVQEAGANGSPITFAGHDAYLMPPPSPSGSSNSSLRRRGIRPRHQDPSSYGQLSGDNQLIEFAVLLIYRDFFSPGSPLIGAQSQINYRKPPAGLTYDPYNPRARGFYSWDCYAFCDGPALVFYDLGCWTEWALYARIEREATTNKVHMSVTEYEDGGGHKCQAAASPGQGQEAGLVDGFSPSPKAGTPEDSAASEEFEVKTSVQLAPNRMPTNTLTYTVKKPKFTGGPVSTTMTLYGSDGSETATITTMLPLETVRSTLTDYTGGTIGTLTYGIAHVTLTGSNGVPISTMTVSNFAPVATEIRAEPRPDDSNYFHPVSPKEYLTINFFPILLALPVSILAQIANSDLRALLPFNSLTRPNGAMAAHSLFMPNGGLEGFVNSINLMFKFREPISFLGDLILIFSAFATSLSSEAVGIKMYGSCTEEDSTGCFMGLAAFKGPSRALEVLLVCLLASIVILGVLLTRWKTGVSSNPQSIAATASLAQDLETRRLFQSLGVGEGMGSGIRDSEIVERLNCQRFFLGYIQQKDTKGGSYDYGVTTQEAPPPPSTFMSRRTGSWRKLLPTRTLSQEKMNEEVTKAKLRKTGSWPKIGKRLTQQPTADWMILGAVLFLCGLFTLILYYETTQLDSPFEVFMKDQGFGVRVVFTGLGVVISLFWDFHFARVSSMEPYRVLYYHSLPAKTSVLVQSPTTVFTGLAGALLRREGFITIVGFSAVLANFTPVLLSAVPFNPSQTWQTHVATAWAAVGCLGFMVLVLVYGAIFVRYPYLPVDPASLGGRIYYLCDSTMLGEFQGMSVLSGKEVSARVDLKKKYRFGMMRGASGERRIGVDYADDDDDGQD
ncbi:hypothetical protein B0H67DRAFT_181584 [Lasiosphaeris hirsuta]|uniref:Uncharacterized protein n=1 Tax=Lasiosphaeris hirsuta TaxID=260670 RepID=A0AA40AQU8_9PEZI|nr:hypothetical protein B0H67DRAFT_181584 [Lasiosphaeris hirsuta]